MIKHVYTQKNDKTILLPIYLLLYRESRRTGMGPTTSPLSRRVDHSSPKLRVRLLTESETKSPRPLTSIVARFPTIDPEEHPVAPWSVSFTTKRLLRTSTLSFMPWNLHTRLSWNLLHTRLSLFGCLATSTLGGGFLDKTRPPHHSTTSRLFTSSRC